MKIDPAEYRKRLDLLTELFTGMVRHADKLAQSRCPYKDRLNRCTAAFGCRNQQRAGGVLVCAGDDKLDYRSAWQEARLPVRPEAQAPLSVGPAAEQRPSQPVTNGESPSPGQTRLSSRP